jgi:hypothetical protein
MNFAVKLKRATPKWVKAPFKTLSLLCRFQRAYGIYRSMASGLPLNAQGDPIPWFTYPAVEFLSRLDIGNRRVFEYGAGNSSLYWASRAKSVVSIERDAAWFKRIVSQAPSNLAVYLRPKRGEYVGSIAEFGEGFDVIVVDGEWREQCSVVAPRHLNEGGLLILDNSDWYPEICQEWCGQGFFEISFSGMGPANRITWVTSVFIKAKNDLQRNMAPPCSLFGEDRMLEVTSQDE